MNLAVLIPSCAAVFNLTSGIVLVSISRAPGWRMARASAAIALTAGLYCVTAIPYGFDGLDEAMYLATARATYVVAVLHTVAWIVFAFGGAEASRAGAAAADSMDGGRTPRRHGRAHGDRRPPE